MNSEDQIRFDTQQAQYNQQLKDRQDKADAKTQGEGEVIIAFINHPGWKILKRDIEIEIETDITSLINCHGTMREREKLQGEIKMLKLFLKSPVKYVDRLKQLRLRQIKK